MAEDFTYKILILGERNVGKTSLLLRFCRDTFNQNIMQSSGLSFLPKEIIIDNEKVVLALWDTAATEAYRSINKAYYRSALGVIMVYDQTDIKTFNAIPSWITEAQEVIGIDKPIVIFGNKSDLTEKVEVSAEMAEEFSSKNQYMFFKVSAKTGYNVSLGFIELAKIIHKSKSREMNHRSSIALFQTNIISHEEKCKC
ncbi:hypothetical protein SteCoe_18237 [Stentor coeruleus]|uniref:Uncharacterized protein n=1 Tax=Stentor coeruleus TaxID=5963 RepID=A0A1R2BX20_9CILI|nr:hypothetical protein SteCoe_18237 [Stentor coeruleus]